MLSMLTLLSIHFTSKSIVCCLLLGYQQQDVALCVQVVGKGDAIRTAFIEMDSEGSGHIAGNELEVALSKAGLKFTRHQMIALRRRLDKDHTGAVAIEEFMDAMAISHS
jgi:EF-hand domain pair